MTAPPEVNVVYAARIALTPTGKKRSDTHLRVDVDKAVAAAKKKFRAKRGRTNLGLAIESEGGLLGFGSEWLLLVAVYPYVAEAAKGIVSGAAKKVGEKIGEKIGEKFVELFLAELRKRHLIPTSPSPAPEVTTISLPVPAAPHTKKEKTKTKRGHAKK